MPKNFYFAAPSFKLQASSVQIIKESNPNFWHQPYLVTVSSCRFLVSGFSNLLCLFSMSIFF